MDRGPLWATVHRVAKSQSRLKSLYTECSWPEGVLWIKFCESLLPAPHQVDAPVGEYVHLFAAWIHRLSTESQRKQWPSKAQYICSRGDWPLDLRDPFQPRTKWNGVKATAFKWVSRTKWAWAFCLMQGPCCSLKSFRLAHCCLLAIGKFWRGGKQEKKKRKFAILMHRGNCCRQPAVPATAHHIQRLHLKPKEHRFLFLSLR